MTPTNGIRPHCYKLFRISSLPVFEAACVWHKKIGRICFWGWNDAVKIYRSDNGEKHIKAMGYILVE